jgi:hypothetical protein
VNSLTHNGRKANDFEADPLHSTYRWELYLTPGHPQNKVGLLDGYSKGQGFENTNKVVLLHRKLVNPILPYLSRCDEIVIYENMPGIAKEFHKKLLELYPRTFTPHGWIKDDMTITDYLERFYESFLQNGKMAPLEDRRKNARQSVYMAELDHSSYNFESLDELKRFCRYHTAKYSYQAMKGWYESHANFQPELFQSDNTENLTHAVHQAKTQEQAQTAMDAIADQAAMDALRGKFNTGRY